MGVNSTPQSYQYPHPRRPSQVDPKPHRQPIRAAAMANGSDSSSMAPSQGQGVAKASSEHFSMLPQVAHRLQRYAAEPKVASGSSFDKQFRCSSLATLCRLYVTAMKKFRIETTCSAASRVLKPNLSPRSNEPRLKNVEPRAFFARRLRNR